MDGGHPPRREVPLSLAKTCLSSSLRAEGLPACTERTETKHRRVGEDRPQESGEKRPNSKQRHPPLVSYLVSFDRRVTNDPFYFIWCGENDEKGK